MSLVKCKECGNKVSTKADACTKCGAKPPKKTSIVKWLVLLFVFYIFYTASKNYDDYASKNSSTIADTQKPVVKEKSKIEPDKTLKPIKKLPPKPTWVTSTSKDKMTGEFSAYALSPRAFPTKKMSFPYSNVHSSLGIGCDKNGEWVYFSFSSAPNLTNAETKKGYKLISTRIKWDEQIQNVFLTQDWGAKFIHFRDYKAAISNIFNANKALLELQWHGQQSVYFEYDLNGSSKAISEIRSLCSRG
ncbi:hypothetical protein [Pseudoalteromonas spongiae]|uniref:Zinc ribbon domain-containing protein n=1 Tax=Pseudoalteromonas spongiae TaxID=298657 RepID=A0ABU8F1D6_9GAMM